MLPGEVCVGGAAPRRRPLGAVGASAAGPAFRLTASLSPRRADGCGGFSARAVGPPSPRSAWNGLRSHEHMPLFLLTLTMVQVIHKWGFQSFNQISFRFMVLNICFTQGPKTTINLPPPPLELLHFHALLGDFNTLAL